MAGHGRGRVPGHRSCGSNPAGRTAARGWGNAAASHEVFFDQSKNNSRTWFDTAACANALNLRAYRDRRKAARFSDLSERDPG